MPVNAFLIISAVMMTLLGALGALFLKKASGFKTPKALLLNFNFYCGGFLYFVSALLNIYLLRYWDYSFVLPLTSVTYIWTLLLSHYALKEKVSRKNIAGVAGILLGVVLLTR